MTYVCRRCCGAVDGGECGSVDRCTAGSELVACGGAGGGGIGVIFMLAVWTDDDVEVVGDGSGVSVGVVGWPFGVAGDCDLAG